MKSSSLVLVLALCVPAIAQSADTGSACAGLPTHAQLKAALVAARSQSNGGFNLDMWATLVNRAGVVCAVAFTGADRGSQWPGSRVISAQKANTANAFSLPKLALSTADLYSAVQPGGSLYGLQASNPVNPDVSYRGDPENNGKPNDPMVGGRIGGVNVFGGGLALYNAKGALIGAIGVSGDSSCADHNIAWRTRHSLNLDFVPAGVGRMLPAPTTSSMTSPPPPVFKWESAPAAGATPYAAPQHRPSPASFPPFSKNTPRFRISPSGGIRAGDPG